LPLLELELRSGYEACGEGWVLDVDFFNGSSVMLPDAVFELGMVVVQRGMERLFWESVEQVLEGLVQVHIRVLGFAGTKARLRIGLSEHQCHERQGEEEGFAEREHFLSYWTGE